MMKVESLKEIAKGMKNKSIAAPNTAVRQPLNGGIILTTFWRLTHWQLSITKAESEPTKKQVEGYCAAFGIPKDSTRTAITKKVDSEIYFTVRIQWPSKRELVFTENGTNAMIVTVGSPKTEGQGEGNLGG